MKNDTKLDIVSVAKILLEINERIKKVLDIFPKGNDEYLLKHLAAASVHTALFMKDLHDLANGTKTNIDPKAEKLFLETCECNFTKVKQ